MSFIDIPTTTEKSIGKTERGRDWLKSLPDVVALLAEKWDLDLMEPFSDEATASWVAPCESPHGRAVLKVGFPHWEADYEIDGLMAWNGGCTVHLIAADKPRHALLLERCEPGTVLRTQPESKQDSVIAELCRELWRTPAPNHIRTLENMIGRWCDHAERHYAELPQTGENVDFELAERGLAELQRLANSAIVPKLLATDLHAGNVLASSRRPWLVIDPKPHVGDACYDLTQHLMNIKPRIESEGPELIERLAALADVNADRLLRWTFGRLCLDPDGLPVAQKLASVL
ncbi:MAG: aminoglycoside phosphotransferase family protein [Woeseiaceae bacterium]